MEVMKDSPESLEEVFELLKGGTPLLFKGEVVDLSPMFKIVNTPSKALQLSAEVFNMDNWSVADTPREAFMVYIVDSTVSKSKMWSFKIFRDLVSAKNYSSELFPLVTRQLHETRNEIIVVIKSALLTTKEFNDYVCLELDDPYEGQLLWR